MKNRFQNLCYNSFNQRQGQDRMKIENIDIEATIEKVRILVREDKQLSAGLKSMIELLILIITLLANRLNLNSTNSSKPPSSDPNTKNGRKTKRIKNQAAKKVMLEKPSKKLMTLIK